MEFYHVGIVVSNLDATASEFEQLLKVKWAATQQREFRLSTPNGFINTTIRFTYSKATTAGAPLLELIEAVPGTPWWPGPNVRAALHHIGFWTDSLAEDAGRLQDAGARVVASLVNDDGTPKVFTYQQLKNGPLVELIDSAHRKPVLAWVNAP